MWCLQYYTVYLWIVYRGGPSRLWIESYMVPGTTPSTIIRSEDMSFESSANKSMTNMRRNFIPKFITLSKTNIKYNKNILKMYVSFVINCKTGFIKKYLFRSDDTSEEISKSVRAASLLILGEFTKFDPNCFFGRKNVLIYS